VTIGAETLAPRTRIQSAPYALHATNAVSASSANLATDSSQLAGQPASFYLDTSAATQTKLGRVRFDNAAGTGFGLEAFGPDGGGYFGDSNNSAYAYIGFGDHGMYGFGNAMGGYFQDRDNSGYTYAGYSDLGIQSAGNEMGGYFYDRNSSGEAYLAYQDDGIQAYGAVHGGYFSTTDLTGWARVAYDGFGGFGILAYGYGGGGFFSDRDGSYAYAGYGAYKILGTGTVSFVQNHPTRKDRTIVYAAPEGDEVAVYTRGSGRLTKGEARVALGETFALVANPDIGVTAHVTPRGDARLWVHEVSPSEIVVRGPADADVAFDYIVYGLRIGFESLPIVQVKKDEAYLPTAATLAEYEAGQPDTVASSALRRFTAERQQRTGTPADLTRAGALAAQINAGREQWLANRKSEDEQRPRGPGAARDTRDMPLVPPASREPSTPDNPSIAAADPVGVEPTVTRASVPVEQRPATGGTTVADAPARVSAAFATTSPIEPGDVVVIDREARGSVRRSDRGEDRTVVGIAVTSAIDGWVEVAVGSVVEVRVDAGYGAIRSGDLLVSSPAPGAAMRATTAEPGTILGKALEPLESGLGTIRVLVMLR